MQSVVQLLSLEPSDEEDVLIQRAAKRIPLRDRLPINCKRELEKQRYFGYLMFLVAGMLTLYFILGVLFDLFLPLGGFHKFCICALLLDVITIGGAAMSMVYFSNFADLECAGRSAKVCGGSLAICGAANVCVALWMCVQGPEPYQICVLGYTTVCIAGGIVLTTGHCKALGDQTKFLYLWAEAGQVFYLKTVKEGTTEKVPIDEMRRERPPAGYGVGEQEQEHMLRDK